MATSKKKKTAKKPAAAKKAIGKVKVKKAAQPARAAKKAAPKKVAAKKVGTKKATPKKAAKSKKTAVVASARPALHLIRSTTAPAALKIPKNLIAPLADRILVAVEGESETTAGGLYIPATASDRPHRGKVLALGPGRRNKKGQIRPLDVQTGDTVLFEEYSGTNVTIEGVECLILREEEVLGIVT